MTIDNYEDVLDVRDIIEEYKAARDSEDVDELQHAAELRTLLDELRGNGGDEQWEGHWYPVTLIRDSYFKEYAQELAEDIGGEGRNNWPYNCINWNQAARELQMDYTSVEYNGITYWYR